MAMSTIRGVSIDGIQYNNDHRIRITNPYIGVFTGEDEKPKNKNKKEYKLKLIEDVIIELDQNN